MSEKRKIWMAQLKESEGQKEKEGNREREGGRECTLPHLFALFRPLIDCIMLVTLVKTEDLSLWICILILADKTLK